MYPEPVSAFRIALPEWIGEAADFAATYPGDEAKMRLAVRLARENVRRGSGGPFGAALFDEADRLVAAGVNRVVPMRASIAHAEIVAIACAQQRLARHRLDEGGGRFLLATSAQPCCQCYGALFWAGLSRVLIGARGEDVERLTEFDEGPLPEDWIGALAARGIEVRRDLLREEACQALAEYAAAGGPFY